MAKQVYMFDEGHKDMKNQLGGKGANLAEMTQIGLPVPYGFTITTDACHSYYQDGKLVNTALKDEIIQALHQLEAATNKKLGDKETPLFVSVRSGSVVSMPGMMDTVLNLGMNDLTVEAQKKLTGNGRFAYDSYRRFIQMFSNVVLGIDLYFFENRLDQLKEAKGYISDPEMTEEDWIELILSYKDLVVKHTNQPFPQDPIEQLMFAIHAVFDSWNNQRAIIYRQLNRIPDSYGTAVNIQSMVFGNTGNDSGTGVAFTRNPSTGENLLYGEFLLNAQGEDVVAGIRTPQPIAQLEQILPDVYQQFVNASLLLEKHYRDMQDIEFTVEQGKLYILQTRNGKRTAASAVRIAVEMAEAGIISKEEALLSVEAEQLNQLLHRRIDNKADMIILTKGLPASPGAATGKVVFNSDEAQAYHDKGEKVILVRPETTPDDIQGIIAAEAVVTSRGGMTSHAAVVARGMGKPCICGVESLKIDTQSKRFVVRETTVNHLDIITIDGDTGSIIVGEVPMIEPKNSSHFHQLLAWADQEKGIDVRANADNKEDSLKALELGAEGIGLCRTEHMFMQADRQKVVKEMILSSSTQERKICLAQLLPIQQGDFEEIFEVMQDLPVTIRLLDPPLHEFLPDKEELLIEVTAMRITEPDSTLLKEKELLLKKVQELSEMNPMLGHRGCRLGLIHPEIYAMQAEAIFLAAITMHQKGIHVKPEIMIPLVGHSNELKIMRKLVIDTAEAVLAKASINMEYTIGTMIEIPRAALTAEQIAAEADFFSFGTNDLTQTTFGYSRDDAEGKFLQTYLEQNILTENPFRVLDKEGVGQLVEIGVNKGRSVKPELKTGICGEHGGEASSIAFCLHAGLDYVSCSPFRVPLARLAAAQATIRRQAIT
ncbi:pyruvate, phosphate dikinase [Gracilibacillus alcaliphilus]|uniref:pyruvate, phosphate dikinase n=1 Tax=Gracilibacillus alcaliphilus TaxID=1401441 RepID=UPI00195E9623|nr:pyruvate, phosphate dikinase [Gracilibacillus alcaliphilus]MBM7675324.1 pyruvate,orthophosphate dikinase [Gracilibacillus alcaliphilus]